MQQAIRKRYRLETGVDGEIALAERMTRHGSAIDVAWAEMRRLRSEQFL